MTGKTARLTSIRLFSLRLDSVLSHSFHFHVSQFCSPLSLTSSTIKNWFHVHQPFVVKMGNSLP